MSGKLQDREIQLRAERTRWLKEVERDKKKHDFRSHAQQGYKRQDPIKRYRSLPLKLMAERCQETLPGDAVTAGRIVAPKKFSLHHNPQEVLRTIFKIAKYSQIKDKVLRVNVNLRQVVQMDLAADTLLAIVLKEIKNECFEVRKAVIRGSYPESLELRREMEEVGITKILMADPGKDNIEISQNTGVRVYRHRQSGAEIVRTLDTSDTFEMVVEKFSDHVNRCLRTAGKELNQVGRKNLCDYIGEVLANAQEHAGIKEWTIVGYLDAEAKVFKALVINFGKTYEETFLELPKDSYAWCEQIQDYVNRHSGPAQKKYGIAPSALITVAALQGRVSSKNASKTDTRGHGTVAMIEFFQRIHDACSVVPGSKTEMAVISGSTHITFDGSHRIKKDQRTGRDVIAFNPNNDLRKMPDGKVVKTMPGVYFPGTIITINFPLAGRLQIREIEQ